MEWKHFVAMTVYIIILCEQASGATTIINVTLVDGQTPNEGRVEYITADDSTWVSGCGDEIGYREASVICRQIGYPGVNNFITQDDQWPFGKPASLAQQRFSCDGGKGNLVDCSMIQFKSCYNAGGVICYESGYTGCFPYSGSLPGELQTPFECGLYDGKNLTISNCVGLCNHINDNYTYAGLYRGDTCLCGNASTIISQCDRVDDNVCSSPCAGRDIERCGGDSHIALFNISIYLLHTNNIDSHHFECGGQSPTSTHDLMELTTPLNNVKPSESDPATTNKYANSPETSTESKNLACPSKPESPCSCDENYQPRLERASQIITQIYSLDPRQTQHTRKWLSAWRIRPNNQEKVIYNHQT